MDAGISDQLSAERPRARAALEELVLLESPSLDLVASSRIAGVLQRRYEELGGQVERFDNETGSHLVADFSGHGAPILLVGHSDTVWPSGTLASRVPFVPGDDVIAGPGAYDMKSGLVIIETALRIAQRLGSRRAVRVVVTADEEVGSPGSRSILDEAAAGACGAIGFESPHPDGALKLGRRGSTRVRLDVTGREAHAALDPEKGVSALDELVDQLLRLRGYFDRLRESGREVLFNVGTVAGGTKANVVAGTATAEIGLRFTDLDTERTVLAHLAKLAPVRPAAVVSSVILSNRPAWLATAADESFVESLAAWAGTELPSRPAAGAGDVNFVAALGIPCVDGFGPRGEGAHAVSERFEVASMFDRIAALTAILTARSRG